MKKISYLLIPFLLLSFVFTACTGSSGGNPTVPTVPTVPPRNDHTNSTDGSLPGQTTNPEESDNSGDHSSGDESGHKILIAYFSLTEVITEGANASSSATPYTGNTESVAKEIQNQIGGDLFKIQTVRTYPTSHSECSKIAEQEMRDNARPELSSHVENMDDYDVIFVGYPIWWYQEPMAIRTFLEEYDLTGKTIIPFCTTMGAGISQSIENIAEICDKSTIVDGLSLSTGRADNSAAVRDFLEKIGLL